jgi:hypothetical protein
MISLPNPKQKMTDRTEIEFFLNEKCREDPDLLATIISEYVWSLSNSKLDELEDFLVNNFGDES